MNAGEVAKGLGISRPLLDFYITKGWLPFDDPKEPGRWRVFTVGHLWKLRQMRELMAFGISAKVASGIICDGDPGAATLVLRLLEPHA